MGIFLIGTRSKLDSFVGLAPATSLCGFFVLAVLSTIAGLVTIHYRKKALHQHRTFYRDATILTTPDRQTIILGFTLLAAGSLGVLLPPRRVDFHHLLMFVLMVISVGLNTYFGSFAFERTAFQDYDSHIESLKLAHQEWSTIFNNVCLALLVTVGGIALGFMKPNPEFPNSPSSVIETMMDAVLIWYFVLGAPILWLLRPIHNLMASIRRDIASLKRPESPPNPA